jgi:lipopolysaccharide export system protein LptA
MKLRQGTFTLLFLQALWFVLGCPGQNIGSKVTIKPIKGFKVAEPFPPPHETQTKFQIQGGKAFPQPGGKTLLSEGVILRTFTETNTPQLVVECQECVYDSAKREVNSSGAIHMRTADGKFRIEGIGFLFEQTNSSLFISNNVHTLIDSASLPRGSNAVTSPADPESGPLVIDSSQFEYDGPSGRGEWRNHVQVTGTNLVLTSETLTSELPTKSAALDQRQVRSLLAETNVDVLYHGLHATGGRLTYAPESGLIRLVSQVQWQADQRHGNGDELILDRSNQVFQVNGHAALYLPGQTLGAGGLLSHSNAAEGTSTNSVKRTVQILCDHYEIRTNWAFFAGQVQLNEQVNQTNRGKMTCEKAMTVTFSGTNELQTLTAEKKVVIEEGDKTVTGGRAFYTHTNTTLEVTDQPRWRDGSRSGKGDLLRLNTQRNEMLVQGTASLTLPANELAGQFSSLTIATNSPARTSTGTNQFAQIFCEQYLLRPEKSVFQGGVYATHPEMNLTCENLAILVPNAGVTNLVAHQNVVFDLMTTKDKVHGTGDQAVYSFGLLTTATNGLRAINELRLTGTPAVLVTTNMTSRNDTIIWDRNRDKLLFPGGDYSIQGMGPAIDTNIFMLPKKKLTK